MKYVKMLGLLAVAATALMAFAGTASATVTSPAGTKYGGEIVATSTNLALDGTVDNQCSHSEIKATPISAGSTTYRVVQWVAKPCPRLMVATTLGHLFIHSNGKVTFTGFRMTLETTILGFPVHCIYAGNNTEIGTLTEGVNPPVLHIGSAPLPQEATSGLCGEDAELTGTYTITKPTTAIVVD